MNSKSMISGIAGGFWKSSRALPGYGKLAAGAARASMTWFAWICVTRSPGPFGSMLRFSLRQELPDVGLVFEIGASSVSETVALAAVAGSEALHHGHPRRIRKSPVLTDAAALPLCKRFCRFNRQYLQSMRFEVVSSFLAFSKRSRISSRPSPQTKGSIGKAKSWELDCLFSPEKCTFCPPPTVATGAVDRVG